MWSKRFFGSAIAALVLILGWEAASAQTLEEILKKHMQALGGEKNLKAQRTSVAEFELIVPGGLTGKYKSYFKYPDKIRSETDLIVIRTLTVMTVRKDGFRIRTGRYAN